MTWPLLIADLVEWGYTQPQIAEACGCSQPTISDLANGKTADPRHSIGERLRSLHKKVAARKAREKAGAN